MKMKQTTKQVCAMLLCGMWLLGLTPVWAAETLNTNGTVFFTTHFTVDGEPASSLSVGTVTAAAELSNQTAAPFTGKYVAVRNGPDEVVDFRIHDVQIPAGGTWTQQETFEVTQESSAVQSFVVNNFTDIRPLFRVFALEHAKRPVVFSISDAVSPGGLVSVRGEYLYEDSVQVHAVPAAGGDAVTLPLVQTDAHSKFLVARLPQGTAAGVYRLTVETAGGASLPVLLNAPRPDFISEDRAFAGLSIRLAGKNLDGAEFGIPTQTEVRLVDHAGASYPVALSEVTPFALTLAIQDQPLGTYYVEVRSSPSCPWQRLGSGQTLTISPPAEDPLGLGVAWADLFAWDNVFTVTDPAYGAVAGVPEVQDEAIQTAIDAAYEAGGGVVYFPAGDYAVGSLELPYGVVLNGAGKGSTRLVFTSTARPGQPAQSGMIRTAVTEEDEPVGRQGIANLSIVNADDTLVPDFYVSFGWRTTLNPAADMRLRRGEHFFLKNFEIHVGMEKPPEYFQKNGDGSLKLDEEGEPIPILRRGSGVGITADAHFLCADSDFTGHEAELVRSYMNEYNLYQNNRAEFATNCIVMVAAYTFVENNHIIGHPEYEEDLHGFSVRGNSLSYNNVIESVGTMSNNDGEAIMNEGPNSPKNFGRVTAGGEDWVEIQPNINREEDEEGNPIVPPERSEIKMPDDMRYGKLTAAITYGTGMGQTRTVTGVLDGKFLLERPWDVVPDETSIVSVVALAPNTIYYKNTIKNCTKGLWFYGYITDSVMSDNVSINSLGTFIHAAHNYGQNRLQFDWYNRIQNTTITGVSRKTNIASIAFNAGRAGATSETAYGQFYSTLIYGTEVRNNTIVGDLEKVPVDPDVYMTESPNVSGIVAFATEYSSAYDNKGVAGDAMNTVITGNQLSNLWDAVNLSRCIYGQVVEGNTYENVKNNVANRGINTIVDGVRLS